MNLSIIFRLPSRADISVSRKSRLSFVLPPIRGKSVSLNRAFAGEVGSKYVLISSCFCLLSFRAFGGKSYRLPCGLSHRPKTQSSDTSKKSACRISASARRKRLPAFTTEACPFVLHCLNKRQAWLGKVYALPKFFHPFYCNDRPFFYRQPYT